VRRAGGCGGALRGWGGGDFCGQGDEGEAAGEDPQAPPGPVAVADGRAVGDVQGAAERGAAAGDGPAGVPALGDQDLFGPGEVPMLAEDPGGLLVGAGVVGGLTGEPIAAGQVVPWSPHLAVLRLLEAGVGETHSHQTRGPTW